MKLPELEFNVSQLLQEAVGETRTARIEPSGDLQAGSVELIRIPRGVLVEAELVLTLEAECSRCLKRQRPEVPLEFAEVFQQQIDPETGQRFEVAEEDAPFTITMDHRIDITEAVRQYVLMATAMQPLCRPDCPGLCPLCGQDLSRAECGCDRNPTDPRWAALAGLKLDETSRQPPDG